MGCAVAHPPSVLGVDWVRQLPHLPLFLRLPRRIVSLEWPVDNWGSTMCLAREGVEYQALQLTLAMGFCSCF